MLRITILILLSALALGCASHSVQNAYQGAPENTALVTSADTVLVKYVDNEAVQEGFIGQEVTYKVDAGKRVLLLEYSDLFSVGSDDHEKVVSRPAKVSFDAEAGKHYRIENPRQKTLEEAQAFAEQPEFKVVDSTSGAEVTATVELSRPRSFLTELKTAMTPEYAFESDQVVTAPVVATAATATGTSATAASPALQQLKTLWGSATDAEREAFMKWIIQK